jgi:glycosyltransferase involved in cell wall biosynthesis
MGKKQQKKKEKKVQMPFVSICTPTFNRRPFFPMIIKCMESQDYPKNRIEWIIIDDGTDKVEDLVKDIPYVKYFRYDQKMSLGKKRNLCHLKSSGSIILYMDDDDFYPVQRISHAVETLEKNPQALCAGSSQMYIYFKHNQSMYQVGPYGPSHATAATFAFRRELLKETEYDETACVAEEKAFLKNYTVPFVQLDPMKTILVFSHIHNSFDKRELLNDPNNPFIKPSEKKVEDFVKDEETIRFLTKEIDELLEKYHPGRVENKPDVVKQIAEIKKNRDEYMQQARMQQQMQQMQQMQHGIVNNSQQVSLIMQYENRLKEMNSIIQNLAMENQMLKQKIESNN